MRNTFIDECPNKTCVNEIIDTIHASFPSKDPDRLLDEDSILTSKKFRFTGRDLYRLLMVIEEKYRIYFQPAEILENGFRSPKEIARLVNARRIVLKAPLKAEEMEGDDSNECCY